MLDAGFFDDLRAREFARLDEADLAYLDYTGSALYAASQLDAHREALAGGVFGNPHSAHRASRASADVIDRTREAVLHFFGVTSATHTVCFTANTTAAAKLVAESYPFAPDRPLLLSMDNHNSINGLREFARARRAPVRYLKLTSALRLKAGAVEEALASTSSGLVAFPAQSNFSGVLHELDLVRAARDRGCDVLLDAAAFVATHALDLDRVPADFTTVSFYKLFGYPTGLGALIARRDSLASLTRPWFAGGTVDYVSTAHDRHQLKEGAEAFEDGTPDFLGLAAVLPGLEFVDRIGLGRIEARVADITRTFLDALRSMRHTGGAPLTTLYGPADTCARGGTVAFNILDRDGHPVSYADVEARAEACGVAFRGGCFCNPGASEVAFGFDPERSGDCLRRLGRRFSVERFAECLGRRTPVGAVRASFGLATTRHDVDRAFAVLQSFAA